MYKFTPPSMDSHQGPDPNFTPPPPIEDKKEESPSVGGFLGNVVKSGANLAGNMISTGMGAIEKPVRWAGQAITGKSIEPTSEEKQFDNTLAVPFGAIQKPVRKVGEMVTGKSIPETPEEQQADAVGAVYKERYGGLKNIARTAYNDPLGLLADASMVAGGFTGAARAGAGMADAANLSRTASALRTAGNASEAVNPATLAGKAVTASAKPLAPVLQRNAETQYGRVLNATTKGNKLRSADIVPELLDRRVRATSLADLQSQARSQAGTIGQAIGDEWQNLPPGSSTPLQPILDRLESGIGEHKVQSADRTATVTPQPSSILDSSGRPFQGGASDVFMPGKPIPMGPQAKTAIGNIGGLQKVLMDVAEADPQTGQLGIPVEKARGLRQYFDKVQKDAGSFEGKNLNDTSVAAAHEMAADSIREELGKQYPDIAKLNKEYGFWKDVGRVVGDTLTRRQGQSVPLKTRMAQAGGFVKGGVIGAEAMKQLVSLTSSPAWATTSAVFKAQLADAIASGNQASIGALLQKAGNISAVARIPNGAPAIPSGLQGAPGMNQ